MRLGFRALVIDDDDFSRATAVRILERLGATTVVQATDGARALALAAKSDLALDVILCDLRMPELDGIETLAGLVAQRQSATFVLASSAEPRLLRAAASSAQRAGITALHVMSKPVTLGKMQAALASMPAEPDTEPATAAFPGAIGHAITPAEIRAGLAAEQFTAFYQPKVGVRDGRVWGAEALVRWRHPRHGVLTAGSFIGAAQEGGLLEEIFNLVLAEAVPNCARWRSRGFAGGISINLPLCVLRASDLPNRLETFCTQHCVPTDRVTFEVTEDGWLHEQDMAQQVLTRLRVRGFGLAIDDFGTGYSGVQQLLNAPFNELKIDGGFVRAAPNDPEAAIAIQSTIALARGLDLRVVAEGVETQAEWNLVAEHGCDEVQGFLVSRAISAEQFDEWAGSVAPWRRVPVAHGLSA